MGRKRVYLLVLAVAALVVLGIVMLFSTGAFPTKDNHGDPYFLLKRQLLWLGIGLVAVSVSACLDYHFWQRHWRVLFALAAVLLALCYVPHIGTEHHGAKRWIGWGALRFQPSDFAKIVAVAFLAHWYSVHEEQAKKLWLGFAAPMLIVGILMALIAREIDMGTTALIGGTMFVVMFVAGAGLRYIAPLTAFGLAATCYIGSILKGRSGRMLAFLHLEQYKETFGLQQWQGLIAFGSGGVEGLGLGNGREKLGYLPFAQTDFIFPTIGEELGLRVTLAIIFCYLLLIACGTLIAAQARDRFGMLFGFGIVVILALQAALNIGVTTALLPNKGLPLPFISYGGSNLVYCLLCVGILINIYRQGVAERPDKAKTLLRARTTPRI